MKKQMPGSLLAALLFPIAVATAQPVVQVDAVSLLDELAAPPTTLAEAYQRAYSDNNGPDATPYYQTWINKAEQYNKEGQALQMQFYQKNPTVSARRRSPYRGFGPATVGHGRRHLPNWRKQ
ncbi:MAG: hypothetical protein IPK76_22780 [Lewinellaceae bacterium]|nr:hypothetical protein [Lewinellaceae bacterium]